MRIGQASQYYADYLEKLREQRNYLLRKKEEQQKEPGKAPNTDIIDLQIKEIDENSEKIRIFTQKLQEAKMNLENMEHDKEAIEDEKEKWEDEIKCFEIFHRISRGDRVPPQDEKKLMEFSTEMYQAAKNLAMMNRKKDPKEYDSLWEEEPEEDEEPMDVDDRAVPIDEPQLTEVKVQMEPAMDAPAE